MTHMHHWLFLNSITPASGTPASRGLFDSLFALRDLSFAADNVQLQFARPWPLWAWILLILALATYAAWSYWRLSGPPAARTALASLRALALLLIALLIAGPQLVRQNERVEKDWVVLMVDRSRSLAVADVPADVSNGPVRTTRDAQLQQALDAAQPALADLAQKRNLLALGFDESVFDLPRSPEGLFELPAPAGQRTALGSSLEAALKRVAARPVAGVVLISDGRSFDQPSRAVLQDLQDRQIPVFSLPLGSASPLPDLAITRIDAPSAAFVGDLIPITIDVDRLGATQESAPLSGRVELRAQDGTVLTTEPLPPQAAGESRITLTTRAADVGTKDWHVHLVLDSPDLSPENNAQTLRLETVDQPIRLLSMDGYPRWESRYLKNLILREKSFRSSNLLVAADRKYIQEGTDRLASVPVSAQEWAPFDVIILGDVRPGLFSQEQLENLRAIVAERGAGLLIIAGESFMPGAWAQTPIAELIPFGFDSSRAAPVATTRDPVLVSPGPAARQYGVLQLSDPESDPQSTNADTNATPPTWPQMLTDPSLQWNALRWSQRIEPSTLKPSAEVLAYGTLSPLDGTRGTATPLVITMRYGAGRVVYVATDETWRYRYGRGETLTERFWIPLIRLLARGSLGRSGQAALLAAAPDRALVNQPVRITLKLLDQSLVERNPATVSVRVVSEASPGGARTSAQPLTLAPLNPENASNIPVSTYATTWVPAEPGAFRIVSDDPLLAGMDLAARVDVSLPEDELRRPQTDHPALASLASATGGRTLTLADLATLPQVLPNRELRILGTPDIETLWDKPFVLVLLISLLAVEWIGRRLIKLS
jgi:hypothetical protein